MSMIQSPGGVAPRHYEPLTWNEIATRDSKPPYYLTASATEYCALHPEVTAQMATTFHLWCSGAYRADMIPRFSNPFSLHQSTVHVSRADLYESDTDAYPSHSAEESSKRKIEELDAFIKSSLGEAVISSASSSRKRQKIETEVSDVASASEHSAPFRLVSRALPPRPVILEPKQEDSIQYIVKDRPSEDDEDEAEERRKRSAAVAVDYAQIIRDSQEIYAAPSGQSRKFIEVQASLPVPPPAMILQRLRQWPLPPTLRPNSVAVAPEVARELRVGKAAPIVEITTGTSSHDRSRRARRKRQQKSRAPPSFWKPNLEWGGKSLGYAMGYEGSSALQSSEVRGYKRDTMRKAVNTD
ncbi:hypothetical protein OE88DRAFT_1647492 [Heliocybe sulcata]|uniref:Uncharacterized protein n=1 Tax=Heliocybe sulcata TaxID=5364 RepID=A0A5C3MQY2_9AGAM|nr:hypothetical protein OE88DRAFT_1647492 [Heliocybe sulcata]